MTTEHYTVETLEAARHLARMLQGGHTRSKLGEYVVRSFVENGGAESIMRDILQRGEITSETTITVDWAHD